MSGGAFEYVMGNYNGNTGSSGFSSMPDSKYYNKYTTSSNYTTGGLQHALIETQNWYSDVANFVDSYSPWFIRGGYYGYSSSAGVFNFGSHYGNASSNYSVRLVITNE